LDEFQIYYRVLTKDEIAIIQGPSGIDYTKKSSEPYVIDYVSTDSQGNTVKAQRKVAVSDDANTPVLTLSGQAEITVGLGTVYTDQGATASDAVDGNLTPFIVVTGEVDTSKAGTYTITYSVEDFSFNVAAPVTRTVTVGNDPLVAWMASTGLEILPVQDQALDADPDKDLVENLLEYAFGSDPTVASDASNLPAASVANGELVVVYPCLKTSVDPDITYTPQISSDLTAWDTTGITISLHPVQDSVPTPDHEMRQATFTIPGGTQRKFVRILVTR
jgi:hypothetical protein